MKNSIKQKLKRGKPSIGTWITIGHPDVTEILAGIGFDWLLFDMEHSPLTMNIVQSMIQAMNGSQTVPLLRVASKDPVVIGQALDAGAQGVVVPYVNTAQEARRVVAACLYPPDGTRGVGPRRASQYGRSFQQYMRTANREVFISVQIETPEAIENIDDILSVKGIDVAAIGPGDLSKIMGCFDNRRHKKFQQALDRVLHSCRKHRVIPGMAYVGSAEKANEYIRRGFRFVGVSQDIEFLGASASEILAKVSRRVK